MILVLCSRASVCWLRAMALPVSTRSSWHPYLDRLPSCSRPVNQVLSRIVTGGDTVISTGAQCPAGCVRVCLIHAFVASGCPRTYRSESTHTLHGSTKVQTRTDLNIRNRWRDKEIDAYHELLLKKKMGYFAPTNKKQSKEKSIPCWDPDPMTN